MADKLSNTLSDHIATLSDRVSTLINTSSSVSNVPQGISSVIVNTGAVIGNVTMSNNMRGIVVRNNNVCIGFVSDYNASNVYVITTDNGSTWLNAKKISAS